MTVINPDGSEGTYTLGGSGEKESCRRCEAAVARITELESELKVLEEALDSLRSAHDMLGAAWEDDLKKLQKAEMRIAELEGGLS